MATKYWVGGNGNWSSATNWRTTSGGAVITTPPILTDAAVLDANSSTSVVTLDISPTIQTLTCTGFTGTLAFGTNTISLNSTGTIFTGATTMTVTGTPQIILTNNSATARTITPTAVTEANSISFRVTAGTGTLSVTTTGGPAVRDLDFTDGVNPTGYGGALQNLSLTIYGNFKASTNMTKVAGTSGLSFAATSGTKTINTAGVTFDNPFAFNGVGGTFQLQGALTSGSTRACTLTNGTLDLNGYTATFGSVSSTNSNVRTFAFGSTGKFVLLNTAATVWTTSTSTNLTVTGTNPLIQLTTNATTGTRTVTLGTAGEANAISVDVSAGSDSISLTTTSGAFKNVNFTGFTGSYITTNSIIMYGDWNWGNVTTNSSTSTITFAATSGTKTITSNGRSFGGLVLFNGVGGTWSLQDALTTGSTSNVTLTNGTLTTNGYAVTASGFSSSNANVRALNLGASTVTLTNAANGNTPWSITDPTNMTLNAGTSSLIFATNSLTITFAGGGFTYYDITLPTGSPYNFQFNGNNTFRNITAINPASPGRRVIVLVGTTTVTGVLSCSGSAANSRNRFASSATGTAVSFVVASVAAISDVDFSDITLTGAAAPVSGTRLGDLKGNTGITFAAGVNKYWNLPAGGVWSDTAWALTSGGAVNANNFPLGQDTVIFDNTGVGASSTISIQYGWAMGTFDASTLTNSVTFNWTSVTGGQTLIFGNVTLTSSVAFTSSGTAPVFFAGRRDGSFTTITSAGVVWPQSSISIVCVAPNSVKLGNNLTLSGTGGLSLGAGALDLNGKVLNTPVFTSAGTLACSIDFNGSYIDVTGNNATVWSAADLTNFSYTGTPTVNFTYSGSTGNRTLINGSTAGGTEANAVDFNIVAGGDSFNINTGSIVRNFTVQPAFTGTTGLFTGGFIYGNLLLSPSQSAGTSSTSTFFAATSGTKTITTNGVTIDRPLTFSGVGGTWALQDALTLGATNGNVTLTNGTFNSNGYTVTAKNFALGSGTKTLTMGASTWVMSGNWDALTNGAGFTVNAGTSTINMSSASAKSFSGNSKTYYNLGQTGLGTLSISGSNTFININNTVQPTTISFEAAATQTVNNFNVSGTAGNLVTLNSLTPSTQFTLAKYTGGKVLVSYVSVTDSAATPAGYWFAPTSQGNVDGGNNTGWNFNTVGGAGGFLPFF